MVKFYDHQKEMSAQLKEIDSLIEIADSTAIDQLIKMIDNESWYLRNYIAKSFSKIGNKAIPYLLKVFQTGVWYVRECVAKSLGEIGDKRAVAPLIELLDDSNIDVRETAAISLGKIATGGNIAAIADVLITKPKAIQQRVINVIKQTDEQVGELIGSLVTSVAESNESVTKLSFTKKIELLEKESSKQHTTDCGKPKDSDELAQQTEKLLKKLRTEFLKLRAIDNPEDSAR